MILTALVLITLSGDGYWIAGRTEAIRIQWNVDDKPHSDRTALVWRLDCGHALLASGRQNLATGTKQASIAVQAPSVRVATDVDFFYSLEQSADHKVLQEGKLSLHLYPDDLLSAVANHLSGKRLFVWDRPDEIPALLTKAKIEHTRITHDADLRFTSPDIVLVGDDQLSGDSPDQSRLTNLAAAGANILILRQTRTSSLGGYVLVRRAAPANFAWREEHPLACALRPIAPSKKSDGLWAIRLGADEPVLPIAWWPTETASDKPAMIDALVAVKAVGRGRLVLCQIPLRSLPSDPRGQVFLAEALDYLSSPVQPTPSSSYRPRPVAASLPEIPTITFPSGGSR